MTESANMVFTDPPYNVDYVGKTREALKIENDHMSPDAFREFLTSVFVNVRAHSTEGSPIYICFASFMTYQFVGAMLDAGWAFKQLIVWVKNAFVLGRSDYQQKHEPILYGWNPGGAHRWYGGRKQTTVWEIDRPMRNAEHPTMKPVILIQTALQNSTLSGDIVLDVFGGSGSTLIACENLNRRCRMMEIDPIYCDVIIERWEKLTGKHAEKITE